MTYILQMTLCLLSQKLQHMQAKTNNLELIAESTDLRISKEKTKVMQQKDKIKLSGDSNSKIWKM